MLRLQVNLQDAGARAGIAAIIRACENRAELNRAMGERVEDATRTHLQELSARRSPHTGFYGKAAQSVELSSDADAAEIRIPHPGMALRFYGGTVTGGSSISSFTGRPTKSQALPTENVPVRNGRRLAPREAGILAFIPTRRGNIHTSGVLVEGVMKDVTRGPRKGQKRAVPKPGGKVMFILRRLTRHKADPTVIPSVATLLRLASEGAADYIASFDERRGP